MNKSQSKKTHSGIVLILLMCFAIVFSAAAAYLNYNQILNLSNYIPWIDSPVEEDDSYRLFLEQMKYQEEMEAMRAYENELKQEFHPVDEALPEPTPASTPEPTEAEKKLIQIQSSKTFKSISPVTYTYKGIENIECTALPGKGDIICSLATGYQCNAIGFDQNQIVLNVADGVYCFADADMFIEGAAYATIEGAVDLRGYLSYAKYDMPFSMDNNITGRSLYPGIPLMETYTADKLKTAEEIFYRDGYRLVIHDAYRPITAQYALFETVHDETFVVDPYKYPSWHNVGRAVDISLEEITTEQEVELPSAVYDFTPQSFRNNSSCWSDEARANVEYITNIMNAVGFDSVESMWWHYELREKDVATTEEIFNYNKLKYEPLC